LYDFVANFVNSLGNISGAIPIPVSFTLTMSSLLLSLYLFSSKVTDIIPPPVFSSCVNLIALFRRLEITCPILVLSACTKVSCSLDANSSLILSSYSSFS
jgi:hypothetical protein